MNLEASNPHIHDYLAKRASQGDRKAQTELYELYSKGMYNVAYRIIGDIEISEDIMQEAFIDAFNKLSQFNYESTFGSWLKRIVINKSLNYLRRKKMVLEKEAEYRNEYESSIMNDGQVETAESEHWSASFSLQDIQNACQQLAKKHSLIFNLYMIEGYDHEEISEIMGITSSTSRSQLSRAKQNLKELLLNKLNQSHVRS